MRSSSVVFSGEVPAKVLLLGRHQGDLRDRQPDGRGPGRCPDRDRVPQCGPPDHRWDQRVPGPDRGGCDSARRVGCCHLGRAVHLHGVPELRIMSGRSRRRGRPTRSMFMPSRSAVESRAGETSGGMWPRPESLDEKHGGEASFRNTPRCFGYWLEGPAPAGSSEFQAHFGGRVTMPTSSLTDSGSWHLLTVAMSTALWRMGAVCLSSLLARFGSTGVSSPV